MLPYIIKHTAIVVSLKRFSLAEGEGMRCEGSEIKDNLLNLILKRIVHYKLHSSGPSTQKCIDISIVNILELETISFVISSERLHFFLTNCQ